MLAVVAKMLATAATIKSGGSAGMLIPSMYMGGLVGAAAYYLLGECGLYAGPSVAVYDGWRFLNMGGLAFDPKMSFAGLQ